LAVGVGPLTQARAASVGACREGVVSLVEVPQTDESQPRASDRQAQARTESDHAAVCNLGAGRRIGSAVAQQNKFPTCCWPASRKSLCFP